MFDFVVASVLAGLVSLLFFTLKTASNKRANFWKSVGVTQLENDLSLRDILTASRSPQDLDAQYYRTLGSEKFGGIIELGQPLLFVKDLDVIKHIMVKDFDYFVDRRDFADSDTLLSKGLFFSRGELWKDVRGILSPTFTSGKIRRMFQHFFNSGEKLQSFIRTNVSVDGGYQLDVSDAAGRFTAHVIGTAVLGIETDVLTSKESAFFEMAKGSIDFSSLQRRIRFGMLQFMPRISNLLRLHAASGKAIDFFKNLLGGIIQRRVNETKEGRSSDQTDFVQLLVEAMRDSQTSGNKFQFTNDLALQQSFVFFVAGYDTVANLLAYSVHCLAVNEEVQRKLADEVQDHFEGGKVSYEDVNGMGYLEMFVSEMLRMYSPVERIERKCTKAYQLPDSEVVIPKGTMVGIPVGQIQQDERYYENPELFDPERFSPERKQLRNPYCYLPFGTGPRNCIGMRFALIEVKVALCCVLRKFRIEKIPGETPDEVKVFRQFGFTRLPTGLKVKMVPISK